MKIAIIMRFFTKVFMSFVFVVTSINCYSTTFYVSAAGHDSGSGALNAPLLTIEKGLSKINEGDSLLLRKGDKWVVKGYLSIKVPNVTVGSYNGGNGSSRPIIDGQKANLGGWSGKFNANANNITIRDLEILNSGSQGVRFKNVNKGLIENVKVDWTYRHGIQSYHSSEVTIRNCEVAHHNNGWKFYGENSWGNGISVVYSTDILVEGNIVREGFGEGIDSFYGSKRVIIQDNLLFNNRAVGIYVDSTQDGIVRRNIILGTADRLYHRGGGMVGPGIALNNEKYQFKSGGRGSLPDSAVLQNVRVYNNLVAGTAAGLAFLGQHVATDYRGVKIAHNIFVDNGTQLVINQNRFSGDQNVIANNIFLSLSSDSQDYTGKAAVASLKFASNHWSKKPAKTFLLSATDIVGGAKLDKMSGWRDISSMAAVTALDFKPLSGSSTIGEGTYIGWIDVSTDFNKGPISKSNSDLGAFQYGSLEQSSPPLAPQLVYVE